MIFESFIGVFVENVVEKVEVRRKVLVEEYLWCELEECMWELVMNYFCKFISIK